MKRRESKAIDQVRRGLVALLMAVVVAVHPARMSIATNTSKPSERDAQANLAVYFIDIGQGNSALIVSPTGMTLLVDGGRDGMGQAAIVPLMRQLGLSQLDYMVATHYDSDHIGGLDEVARAFPPKVAYDSGELTQPQTNSGAFGSYRSAIGATRRTITPGTVIALGDGVTATCIVVNGELISGGRVAILGRRDRNDQPDNSSSIGLLIQYEDFDLFISGDLTGGGLNTTDVESIVSQLVGDVDVLQLNHHGSRTSNNRTFLSNLKAELGIVQAGRDNGFGHPTIDVTDRFINTPPTSSVMLRSPMILQNEPSPSDASSQGIVANGTILIETEGTSYTVSGGNLQPITFLTDGAESGTRTDFPPSVMPYTSPVVPVAGQTAFLYAEVHDDSKIVDSITMSYSINGSEPMPLAFDRISDGVFAATIPGQPDGARVEYVVTARDTSGHITKAGSGYFAGVTPISALRVNDSNQEPIFLNFTARVMGIVTVGTGTFSKVDNDVYLQDSTGGINIFERTSQTTRVNSGDRATAVGRIESFNGLLQLNVTNPTIIPPFTSPFGLLVRAREPVEPTLKTLADLNEALEGTLVQINNVRITSGTIPPTERSANLTISDGTASLTLRIDSNTNIPGMNTPVGVFNLVGVVGQFDRFRPFNRDYQILPRSRDDFIFPSTSRAFAVSRFKLHRQAREASLRR